jgi:uncharacterized protein (DUF2147 family)
MKKPFVIAALLMATTAAHAGNSISFEIKGQKIHIEAPKDCSSLSCLKVSAPGLSDSGFDFKGFKSKHLDDDNNVAERADPPPPNAAPAPAGPATAPAATVASADSMPGGGSETRSAPAAATPVAAAPATAAPAAAAAAGTPIGVWATEENKGNVRVEPCGPDLCGYADKTNEKILINMKPSDSKWVGRIHDPDSGRTYDSTIAMKGPNTPRVQGCAFGGMFCGGQTWKRVS